MESQDGRRKRTVVNSVDSKAFRSVKELLGKMRSSSVGFGCVHGERGELDHGGRVEGGGWRMGMRVGGELTKQVESEPGFRSQPNSNDVSEVKLMQIYLPLRAAAVEIRELISREDAEKMEQIRREGSSTTSPSRFSSPPSPISIFLSLPSFRSTPELHTHPF